MAVKKKIVLLGDSAVGKTSLSKRFVIDLFEDAYITTVGSKVTRKELRIQRPDRTVDLNLMIWDLLGREGYTASHARTFAGVHGALLVADLTRRETLDTLERYWIPTLFKVVENVPLVFVANKADLARRAEWEESELAEVAARYNVGLADALPSGLSTSYATSAKTGENVERAFETLGHLVLAGHAPADPVKELYESLVAMGVARASDKSTPIGALDAILVDFCQTSGIAEDERVAMVLLRQEVLRAGIDVRSPTKEGILRLVDYLAEVESEFRPAATVAEQRERRLAWASGIAGKGRA
jgi:small GTP-binding protein